MTEKNKTLTVDPLDLAAGNGLMNRRVFLNSVLVGGASLATASSAFTQEAIVGEGQEEWTLMPGDD